jgi:hypothetical protein
LPSGKEQPRIGVKLSPKIGIDAEKIQKDSNLDWAMMIFFEMSHDAIIDFQTIPRLETPSPKLSIWSRCGGMNYFPNNKNF